MAHVGRFYELANRRDMCNSVVHHNRSWPKTFLVSAQFEILDPGPVPDFALDIPATIWGNDWSSDIEYRSETFLVYGQSAHWRIRQVNYNKPDHYQFVRFDLWSDHSVGWSLNNNLIPGRCDILSHSATFGNTSFNDPDHAWWPGTTPRWQIFAAAKPWASS